MIAYTINCTFIDNLLKRVLDDETYKTFEDILWTKEDGGI